MLRPVRAATSPMRNSVDIAPAIGFSLPRSCRGALMRIFRVYDLERTLGQAKNRGYAGARSQRAYGGTLGCAKSFKPVRNLFSETSRETRSFLVSSSLLSSPCFFG